MRLAFSNNIQPWCLEMSETNLVVDFNKLVVRQPVDPALEQGGHLHAVHLPLVTHHENVTKGHRCLESLLSGNILRVEAIYKIAQLISYWGIVQVYTIEARLTKSTDFGPEDFPISQDFIFFFKFLRQKYQKYLEKNPNPSHLDRSQERPLSFLR